MKILVDEMPTKVEDCPWSSPIKDSWNDRIFWFCNWSLSNATETCPMANNNECPYFTAIAQKSDLDRIIDAFNAIPEVYSVSSSDTKKGINL